MSPYPYIYYYLKKKENKIQESQEEVGFRTWEMG